MLEVLIALALFGLLLAALTQGVRFGLTAWGLQDRALTSVEALDATDRSLRLLIGGMEPDLPGAAGPVVTGHADSLTFISRLPLADQAERRADMTLLRDDRSRLILRWRPHRHERGPVAETTDTVLLDAVDGLEMAYWRPGGPGHAGGWVENWAQVGRPALIRVRLRFPKGDPRHWPDMIIAPALDSRGP